jgi:y4mF family transcriptional regulator
MELKDFVKEKRRLVKHTQPDLAKKAGVGLRFLRELEQGKKTLRIDKVNKVLWLFGYELGPVEMSRDLELSSEPGEPQEEDDKNPKMDRYL